MTYDHWKATNPADEELGSHPQNGDLSGEEEASQDVPPPIPTVVQEDETDVIPF
jgi:hypothetical protein